jgi:hypothetical protein
MEPALTVAKAALMMTNPSRKKGDRGAGDHHILGVEGLRETVCVGQAPRPYFDRRFERG